ncbi:MAG: replication restart helicase PriA [Peptoanaerobacter stomatis]|uniref:replication restart helicase PriA n=1 Tax=Peptoanaerobacter stomatis TaxID=796937 RepID=UPI003FA1293E
MNTYDLSLIQQSKYIDMLFTYKSDNDYNIGDIVIVPFGIGNKVIEGIIIYKNKSEVTNKTKEIISALEHTYSLTQKQIDTAIFIRDNYMCSYYEAFKLFTSPSKYTKLSEHYTINITLNDKEKLQELIKNTRKNAKNKLSFLNAIAQYENITKPVLEEMLDIKTNSYINELEQLNIITTSKLTVFSKNKFTKNKKQDIKLNAEQATIFNSIKNIYDTEPNKSVLLHGITGSGKTQVYIEIIKYLLSKQKTAIILVPEISLTIQTISRFSNEFDEDIAIIHSNLTKREKFEQWLKIKNKISKIVIGARSALFSPLEDIGVIIIDECHDEAYKSEQSPKYDTIEVANKIAKQNDALLILATATPSITQYYEASKLKKYHLFKLLNRANNKPLPQVVIVNMLEEMKNGNNLDLSKTLQLEMKRELAKGNSIILFLNKRGYSNQLTCDNCGYVPKCENCDISLTYHKTTHSYKCHYCGYEVSAFSSCPKCNEGHFMMLGTGTQKIENQVKQLFPSANIFRMDKDTSKEKGMSEKILTDFRNTSQSVLIGTQMIGKGHDFPKVSLVGVINADQGINSPDYKALERSYNIIEQVGGRAGRGSDDGTVIIQTFSHSNSLLFFLKNHNYDAFYQDELEKRQIFRYEPFGNLIRITVSSIDEKTAFSSAIKVKEALTFYNNTKLSTKLKIYDVSPCLITRIEQKYRYQIVLRSDNETLSTAKKMINYTLTAKRKIVLSSDNVSVSIDVNPDNML